MGILQAREDDDLARAMRAQVDQVPPFRALVRGVESALIRRYAPDEGPVLDLGCGDGTFAALTLRTPLAWGVDPALDDLERARRAGIYEQLSSNPAHRMPVPDGSCGMVLANSVLEHIPDLPPVLCEAARVLRPGGWLVITAPSHRFGEGFGVAVMLERAGMPSLAGRYRRWFNGLARHHHMLSAEQWRGTLADAGFSVVHHEYYLSRSAMFWFDLLHYVSVPCLAARKTVGRWHWLGRPVFARAWTRALLGLARRPPEVEGACVFVLARKDPS